MMDGGIESSVPIVHICQCLRYRYHTVARERERMCSHILPLLSTPLSGNLAAVCVLRNCLDGDAAFHQPFNGLSSMKISDSVELTEMSPMSSVSLVSFIIARGRIISTGEGNMVQFGQFLAPDLDLARKEEYT